MTVRGLLSGPVRAILERQVLEMLLVIAGVILVLWLLGLVAIPATGGLINILLIVALVVIVAHFLGIGRSSARG
jgi:Family of unknown function (DUF5670)